MDGFFRDYPDALTSSPADFHSRAISEFAADGIDIVLDNLSMGAGKPDVGLPRSHTHTFYLSRARTNLDAAKSLGFAIADIPRFVPALRRANEFLGVTGRRRRTYTGYTSFRVLLVEFDPDTGDKKRQYWKSLAGTPVFDVTMRHVEPATEMFLQSVLNRPNYDFMVCQGIEILTYGYDYRRTTERNRKRQ